MRYLLLVFLLALQSAVFGYSSNNRAENYAQKILTSEKSDLNARSYYFYRYYSPETGLYVSQDPAQLMGGDNFYAFVKDVNSWIDVFGLSGEITVVRLDADSPSGNHYAVFYEKDGQSRMTDLWGADGETVTPKDRPNTKLPLNDVPDVDKKVITVTGNLDDAIKRTQQQFKNKPYKLGKIDCYQYV